MPDKRRFELRPVQLTEAAAMMGWDEETDKQIWNKVKDEEKTPAVLSISMGLGFCAIYDNVRQQYLPKVYINDYQDSLYKKYKDLGIWARNARDRVEQLNQDYNDLYLGE